MLVEKKGSQTHDAKQKRECESPSEYIFSAQQSFKWSKRNQILMLLKLFRKSWLIPSTLLGIQEYILVHVKVQKVKKKSKPYVSGAFYEILTYF